MSSPPLTPVINEENKDAAMKLFAAYNGHKEHISPTITSIQQGDVDATKLNVQDIMSCGIQGGSVSFNPEADRDTPDRHGILRSYTIGPDYKIANRLRFKTEGKKFSSYSGSQSGTPTLSQLSFTRKTDPHSPERQSTHCYPIIKIINENNVEQNRFSDSDGSVCKNNSVEVEHQPETKVDVHDSGYPSTTMSNVTQSSIQYEDSHPMHVTTASERRKLFTSKAKSASFYNIGTVENDTLPVVNDIHKFVLQEKSVAGFRNQSHSIQSCSFESERCRSCHREEVERHAYSYESDLDKIHRGRHQYTFDDRGHYSRHRHTHHRHRCGCSKQNRHHSRDIVYHSNQKRKHYSKHGSEILPFIVHDRRRHGENDRYVHMYSSTDSDSFIDASREHRWRRHNYRTKGIAYSDGSNFHSHDMSFCSDKHPFDIKSSKNCSYKTKQMHMFLKDAYKAKLQGYDNMSYLDDVHDRKVECRMQNNSCGHENVDDTKQSGPRLERRSNTVIEITEENIDKNCPPKPPYTHPSKSRINYSPNHFSFSDETVKQYLREYEKQECIEDGTIGNTAQSSASERNLSNTDESVTGFSEHGRGIDPKLKLQERIIQKDSAYQTKQSSVDRIKEDRILSNSGSLKNKTGISNVRYVYIT